MARTLDEKNKDEALYCRRCERRIMVRTVMTYDDPFLVRTKAIEVHRPDSPTKPVCEVVTLFCPGCNACLGEDWPALLRKGRIRLANPE